MEEGGGEGAGEARGEARGTTAHSEPEPGLSLGEASSGRSGWRKEEENQEMEEETRTEKNMVR